MAHFAKINENNIVENVLRTSNQLSDEGYGWLIKTFGGTWIKTSYNTQAGIHLEGGIPLRKNYAQIGYSYNKDLDAFIPPKPYESWILNEDTCNWEAPVLYPDDENNYIWNEETISWDLVPQENN